MAPSATRGRPRNHLLSSLSAVDFGLLKENLQAIKLPLRRQLEEPNKPIKHIYFPDSGIVSVVAKNKGTQHIELGIIGREGMTGLNVVMGNTHAAHTSYVQMAGTGHRITAKRLRMAMDQSKSLLKSMLRFAQAFMNQISYTALANGRAKIDERLARWLLMAHDRVDGDEFNLTHEYLALMMSVRRAGVTNAISSLKCQGIIDATRGKIIVRDRVGLKRTAKGFYGLPEAEYRRLTGWNAKR